MHFGIYARHQFLPAESDSDAHSRSDAPVSSPSFSTITVGMNDLNGLMKLLVDDLIYPIPLDRGDHSAFPWKTPTRSRPKDV